MTSSNPRMCLGPRPLCRTNTSYHPVNLLLLGCWLALPWGAVAQGPATTLEPETTLGPATTLGPETTFEDQVDVVEVQLDVIVTDDDGQVVTGLGRDDFFVTEDAEPVDILAVDFLDFNRRGHRRGGREAEASDAPQLGNSVSQRIDLGLGEAEGPRYFVIFFQIQPWAGLYGRLVHAGNQLGWWAEDSLGPEDYVAVVGFDNKLKLYQDFTRDVEKISQASVHAAGRWKAQRLPPDPGAPSLFEPLPKGRRLLDQTPNIQKALKTLAQASGTLGGRKHFMFFGLGHGLWRSERGLLDRQFIPTMVETLNDHNVAVHTFNMKDPSDIGNRYDPTLVNLSRLTGGIYQPQRNFFTPMLGDTFGRIGAVYLVSYRTLLPRDVSGYREIVVRTRDQGHRIDSRQGYLYGEP